MKRLLCLAFAAVALAACGGSGDARLSKAGYQEKLHAAFMNAFNRAQTLESGSPGFFRNIARSYDEVARTLKDARAPRDVQTLNDRLVAAASAKAASLNGFADKLDAASPPERRRLLAQYDFSEGQAAFDSAVAALEATGYRFRPSGGR